MSRTLTLDGQDVTAPPRAARDDAQALVSLAYWWGARQLVVERRAYDQGQHDALEARLLPLEAWVADPANATHPRFHEAEGRRQELENWRLTYSQSWLRMMAHRLTEIDGIARAIAERLSDAGRARCREIGWSDEVCRGTPF